MAKHSVTNLKDLDAKIGEIINSLDDFDNDKQKALLRDLVPFVEKLQDNVISFNQIKA